MAAPDIRDLLRAAGAVAAYRLVDVTACADPLDAEPRHAWVFGDYRPPGRIRLFPVPWDTPLRIGEPDHAIVRWLRAAGADLRRDALGVCVSWPDQSLRAFQLAVLRHELGHHIAQSVQRDRPGRSLRTRDHEARADQLARDLAAAGGAR